jgi:hypothetical protein
MLHLHKMEETRWEDQNFPEVVAPQEEEEEEKEVLHFICCWHSRPIFFGDVLYSIHLILYGLFNNHISSSACVELERTWKEAYVVVSDTVTWLVLRDGRKPRNASVYSANVLKFKLATSWLAVRIVSVWASFFRYFMAQFEVVTALAGCFCYFCVK